MRVSALWKLATRRGAATATSYGLIVGLIAVACIAALSATGGSVSKLFDLAANVLRDPVSDAPGANLTANPASLDGGTVTASGSVPALGAAQTVTISNTGGRVASGLSTALSGALQFTGGGDGCSGRTLQFGQQCSVTVQAVATGNGALSGILTVMAGNDGAAVTVAMAGTATGFAPVLSLDSGDLAVARDGSGPGACTALAVRNTGTAEMTGLALGSFGGTDAASFAACSDVDSPCAGTLAVGASCNFGVALTAAVNGSYSATVAVAADGGLGGQRALAGTVSGLEAVLGLAFADGPPAIAGSSPSACSAVTLGNGGNATASVQSLAVTAGTDNFALCAAGGHACPAALPFDLEAAETCSLGIVFQAVRNASYSGTLSLGYADNGAPAGDNVRSAALGLSGTAAGLTAAPVWRAADGSAADGTALNVAAGGSSGTVTGATRTFLLHNGGNGATAALTMTASAGFVIGTNGCAGMELTPNAECSVAVAARSDRDAALTGTLTASAAGMADIALPLSGTASGWPASFAWFADGGAGAANGSGMNVAYDGAAPNGTGTTRRFALKNTGTGSGTATVSVSNANVFGIDASDCQRVLAAGAYCTVIVTSKATGDGTLSANLLAVLGNASVPLPLSGTASGWPASLVWRDQNDTAAASGSFTMDANGYNAAYNGTARTIRLVNKGAGSTTLTGVTLQTGTWFTLSGGCVAGTTLAPAASCSTTITPRADSDGTYSDSLLVAAGSGAPGSFALTTTASNFAPNLVWRNEANTAAADATGINMNNSTGDSRNFTLINTGGGAAHNLTIYVSDSSNNLTFFSISGNCGSSLARNASCRVTLTNVSTEYKGSGVAYIRAAADWNSANLYATQVTTSTCSGGWVGNSYLRNCFQLVTTASTQPAAKANCQSMGGRLATMKTQNQQNAVMSSLGIGDIQAWIGPERIGTSGNVAADWVWPDGSAVSWGNWNTGEPNNAGGEYCTHIFDATHLWNDVACTASLASICERAP